MQGPWRLASGSQTPDLRGLGIPHRKKEQSSIRLYGRRLRGPVRPDATRPPTGVAVAAAPPSCCLQAQPVISPPPSLRDGSVCWRQTLRADDPKEEEDLLPLQGTGSVGSRRTACGSAGRGGERVTIRQNLPTGRRMGSRRVEVRSRLREDP